MLTRKRLPDYRSKSMADMFNIYNMDGILTFNLLQTFNVDNLDNISPRFYTEHIWTEDDHWTLLSYKYYGTIELYYMILKFNEISNPFETIPVGTRLKIPTRDAVDMVLDGLKK